MRRRCRTAHDDLITIYERIDHQVEELRQWSGQMNDFWALMTVVLKTGAFQGDLVAATERGHILE